MNAKPRAPSPFPLGDEETLTPAMKTLFAKCRAKLGFVPNVLRALTFRPGHAEGFTALHDALMLADSPLSKLEREMVAVVVSAANRCIYCLAAHGAAVRALAKDPELALRLTLDYRTADLTPRHRAMLDYAWKLTKNAKVDAADIQALRDHGLDDEAVFDLGQVAAFFNYTNRAASALGLEPNAEYLDALTLAPQ